MAAKELREGLKAPAFDLPAANAERVASRDLRGEWYVLFFYPRAKTSGCTREAEAFQAAKGKFTRKNTKILGISRDSVKANTGFAEKSKLTYPLLSDPERTVHEKYGVMKEKKMYGKTVLGVDRSTFLVDPEGRIRKMWRGVKVPGHVDDVYEALKNVQAEDAK